MNHEKGENMKWSIKEDEIVCAYYLKHCNDWQSHLDLLMDELKKAGFPNRDLNSTKMRISNYSSLYTGVGLNHPSRQSKEVYQRLTKK